MLHALNRAWTARPKAAAVVLLLAALLAAGLPGHVRADGTGNAQPDGDAARLADEVLGKSGGNDGEPLGEWTRSIMDRALERAGEAARRTVPGPAFGEGEAGLIQSGEPEPLPAERHAAGIAGGASGRAGAAQILIFTSLSVPRESWRQWAREAAKTGAPLVLRGVSEDGMRATVKQIGARLDGAEAGVTIDPRLFRLFGVTRVPAVVVVPNAVPPCRSRGCAEDPAPPHDLVTGNIGLAAALETIADQGDAGRDTARIYLQRLRGEDRP